MIGISLKPSLLVFTLVMALLISTPADAQGTGEVTHQMVVDLLKSLAQSEWVYMDANYEFGSIDDLTRSGAFIIDGSYIQVKENWQLELYFDEMKNQFAIVATSRDESREHLFYVDTSGTPMILEIGNSVTTNDPWMNEVIDSMREYGSEDQAYDFISAGSGVCLLLNSESDKFLIQHSLVFSYSGCTIDAYLSEYDTLCPGVDYKNYFRLGEESIMKTRMILDIESSLSQLGCFMSYIADEKDGIYPLPDEVTAYIGI